MTITVDWFDQEKTIVLLRFTDKWTWEECYKTFANELTNIIAGVNYDVYIIADFLPAMNTPLNGVTHARRLFPTLPSNWTHVIVVSDDRFTQVMVDVFRKMNYQGMGSQMIGVKSIEHAMNIIDEFKETSTRES